MNLKRIISGMAIYAVLSFFVVAYFFAKTPSNYGIFLPYLLFFIFP